jgi:hypothetical protein
VGRTAGFGVSERFLQNQLLFNAGGIEEIMQDGMGV